MCHAFFERMSKKYNVKIERSKENQELVNSYIGAINEAEAERLLSDMNDEKIYEMYVKLFKRKKHKEEVQAYV
jgi:RNA binding exosome subunit